MSKQNVTTIPEVRIQIFYSILSSFQQKMYEACKETGRTYDLYTENKQVTEAVEGTHEMDLVNKTSKQ